MRSGRGLGVASVLLLVGLAVAGCSDDDGTTSTTAAGGGDSGAEVTICDPEGAPQADEDLPQVAMISEAVEALEAELGGPASFFEINVTARLVNLFVALNDAEVVQPWLYIDGELSSQEGQPATGGTFTATDLEFDPEAVLSGIRAEVPDAILESFYVQGDGQGNLLYGVLASARCGGGLDIIVGGDGTVKSVDPTS